MKDFLVVPYIALQIRNLWPIIFQMFHIRLILYGWRMLLYFFSLTLCASFGRMLYGFHMLSCYLSHSGCVSIPGIDLWSSIHRKGLLRTAQQSDALTCDYCSTTPSLVNALLTSTLCCKQNEGFFMKWCSRLLVSYYSVALHVYQSD